MTKVKAVANVEEADTPPAVNIEEQAEKDKPEKKESLYLAEEKEEEKIDEDVGRGNATTGEEGKQEVSDAGMRDAPVASDKKEEETFLHFTKIEYVDEEWTPDQRKDDTVYITPDRREYIPGHIKPHSEIRQSKGAG